MFDEATRRDPAHERTWIALVDGNRQQIDAITTEAGGRGVNVTVLVDFVHVLEYVWKAAWTFFYPGDPDAEAWVADHARTILAGRAVDAAATIAHQADAGSFRGNERTGADEAVAYLTNKAPYLDYATALTSGWPIATGVIECACRYLVKDRMDITGARWSLHGAEAILKLRALITNGHFEQYWDVHQHQQLRRNHLNRYKELDLAALPKSLQESHTQFSSLRFYDWGAGSNELGEPFDSVGTLDRPADADGDFDGLPADIRPGSAIEDAEARSTASEFLLTGCRPHNITWAVQPREELWHSDGDEDR
jgi:hypothetical protein